MVVHFYVVFLCQQIVEEFAHHGFFLEPIHEIRVALRVVDHKVDGS